MGALSCSPMTFGDKLGCEKKDFQGGLNGASDGKLNCDYTVLFRGRI